MRDIYLTVGKVLCLGFLVPTLLGITIVRPPHFHNGYEYTVRLEVELSDNMPGSFAGSFTLEPNIGVLNQTKGITCTGITVYSEDGVLLAEYPEEVLNELKAKSVDDYEFWVVTEEGLFMIPKGHTSPNKRMEYIESIQQ